MTKLALSTSSAPANTPNARRARSDRGNRSRHDIAEAATGLDQVVQADA